jgi:acyl-CoA reductase-like NAD-dependent aldehyde dehydrogenase
MSMEEALAGLGQLINGKIVTTGKTFDVVDPSNGEVFASCPEASLEMVDQAMAAAEAALPAWAADEARRRQAIIDMGAALQANLQVIGEIVGHEKGSSGLGETWFADFFAKHLAAAELPEQVLHDDDSRLVKVVRKPVGVVAAIVPWNAPVLILCEKIFSALVCGNTMVAKPSPFTPLSALYVAKLFNEILPPGVLNVLAGGDDLGKAIVAHPTTRMITFTGSVAAGKQIMASAAPGLKNVCLELGGNDAAIVLPDADLDKSAFGIYGAAMSGTGQICAAVKRVYVHESVYEDFVDRLVYLAGETKVGSPDEEGVTMGPLSNKQQFDRVCGLVEDALEHGGKAVTGGAPLDRPGYFYPPTIITGVGKGVRVVDEEQFGPVLPVIPYSDVDDAIAQANGTEYGLGGSVWTSDVAKGQELAQRLESGSSWVNTHSGVSPEIPFGGVKGSGIGRSCGDVGLDEYCELKTVIVNKA